MIQINNVQTIRNVRRNISIESNQDISIDASHLTVLPGLIDPHVHFRVPGHEYKEDWHTAAKASLCGGYTTVLDMPNNMPACSAEGTLNAKLGAIEEQLRLAKIPLRYHLYFGADRKRFHEIPKVVEDIIAIKVFMGSSTGDLLMDDESSLHAIFSIASHHNLLVAVHAEDEQLIKNNSKVFEGVNDFSVHSKIRNSEVAEVAVSLAIKLAKMYGTRLYILHVSTKAEIKLIKRAKKEGVAVYAEACPHHLFLNTKDYPALQGRGKMNPPLRDPEDQQALQKAINDNIIDTIGSDHAPHTLQEKETTYRQCCCGVPGIETTLALLLNAYNQGLFTLEKIVELTVKNPMKIFNLPPNKDYVLVDLNKTKTVEDNKLVTKCGWSPFSGKTLKGWPVYTVLENHIYDIEELQNSKED